MFRLALVSFVALLGLSSALPTHLLEARDTNPYPYPPVNFTSPFRSFLCANSTLNVSWTGGSGRYDLFTILDYPNLPDTHPGFPLRNVSDTNFLLPINALSTYPENSTLSIGVEDGNAQGYYDSSYNWTKNSGPLPIVNCDSFNRTNSSGIY